MVLWEGLPGFFEVDSRAHELATKPTFTLGGQVFYTRPLALSAAEAGTLSDAVRGHRSYFRPWAGLKFCGGFHADYALEWRRQGRVIGQALICFTCREVQLIVGERSERVDQSAEGHTALRALLIGHRQERPAYARSGDQAVLANPGKPAPGVPVAPPRVDVPPLPSTAAPDAVTQ